MANGIPRAFGCRAPQRKIARALTGIGLSPPRNQGDAARVSTEAASDFPSRAAFLAVARRELEAFYGLASGRDAMLMDNLVMARVALLLALNLRRDGLPPEIRARIERMTDATELLYTRLREAVRASASFQALPGRDQVAVRLGVFTVWSPVAP